jgi:tRNA pseudouridine32 synthase/23S rRNA pseudouridine746 synthase
MILQEIYKDVDLVAVDKPSGLLSVPGRSPLKKDCLLHRVQARYPEALLVHRLDMDTSGIMLFARSLPMQRALSGLFEKREIKKEYIAWVEGVVEQEQGVVELPLRKDMQQSLPPRHIVDHQQGKPAFTQWRVCERAEMRTRLLLTPVTGRSHQLRVHMAEMGHPIVGDPIYGKRSERLLLHAHHLRFTHPVQPCTIELESPAPF